MTEELDEALLAQRAAENDAEALSILYRQTAGNLTAVCHRYIRDVHDMKDVLQDSYLKIFAQISRFHYRGKGSLKAWMTRIVVNESITFLRRRERFDCIEYEPELPDHLTETPFDEQDMEALSPQALQEMIGQLPTGYRTVLNLYVFEDKSHQEIAQLLGIKESSSASQLHRAKQMLARQINEYRKK